MSDLLVRTIELDCEVDHAFMVFTQMIDLWWPRGHRKHRDGALRLEAKAGGALIDRSAAGVEWTMGVVTAVEPPSRLELDWYPGSDGAPTSVELRFVASPRGSQMTIRHRPLLETKSRWPQRVDRFADGWDAVLPAFKSHAEEY